MVNNRGTRGAEGVDPLAVFPVGHDEYQYETYDHIGTINCPDEVLLVAMFSSQGPERPEFLQGDRAGEPAHPKSMYTAAAWRGIRAIGRNAVKTVAPYACTMGELTRPEVVRIKLIVSSANAPDGTHTHSTTPSTRCSGRKAARRAVVRGSLIG